MAFPRTRMRRLRYHPRMRDLVRETRLSAYDLIMPLFVRPGRELQKPIPSMPGQFQLSVDRLLEQCRRLAELGVPAVMLFGIPENKDDVGSESWSDEGIVQQAVGAVKAELGERLLIMTDVCFCEYTSHGHCGPIVDRDGRKDVDNDATLLNLAKQAISHVRAGADVVAPSGMMDGMVQAIRRALDAEGFQRTPILSYAAKFASAFYGPFRDAAESTPQFGDRRTYQMDPPNVRQAMREVELDIEEGADLVMVKPALAYMDIIRRVKDRFDVPVCAYNVSGEYAMVKAAAAEGWIDPDGIIMEILVGLKRAGADMILTYHAPEVAELLSGKGL